MKALQNRVIKPSNTTANQLRLCEKQARRLISREELPAFRFGTALRINKADIAAYVAARRIMPVMKQGKQIN
jgi:excisionase family DNA binding protein